MSNKKFSAKLLSILVCFVLITAIALTASGCQNQDQGQNDPQSGGVSSQVEQQVKFTFKVVDGDGKETSFEISTAEKTVGAALLKEGLIEGEDGQYGLYVKKVNGITADYDTDGTYWAFYIGDNYASTGVDATEITAGEIYTFKVEKG